MRCTGFFYRPYPLLTFLPKLVTAQRPYLGTLGQRDANLLHVKGYAIRRTSNALPRVLGSG